MPTAHAERGPHRIWYETAGESGSPVLLIMGLTMSGIAWHRQVEAFAPHHRVAVFDHAGVGDSGPISVRRLTMDHLRRDALSVMDDLGWERAHVVGISMGGMIAQHLALDARERVLSLTLAATHAGGRLPVLPTASGARWFLKVSRAKSQTERLDAMTHLLFSDGYRRANPEAAREAIRRDFKSLAPFGVRLRQLHAVSGHHTAPRLHELRGLPTLVIRPGQDILVPPRESDRLARLIPEARLARIDEAGHGVSREGAERFNQASLEHFARA
ncbi:MAG: alpha/beta fold hydrolase [Deltaproteobacteria bacterium]|nr:alpha/beta fold hydrolase [Deltaproteobacteria bacterium]